MNSNRKSWDDYFIWLIILAAAIIRLYNLVSMSLSNDELSSVVRVRYSSFSEMIRNGVFIDFHPAAYQAFLYYYVKIFGDGVFAIRFPSVFFSLISVYLIYIIGKRWFSKITGLLAAAVFAFSGLTIMYTQFARMYSPGIMFCLLTVYCWDKYLFSAPTGRRKIYFIGWIISTALALQLHYFSFVFAAIVGITGLFFVDRENLRAYLLGGIISLLTFLPEIQIFLVQIKTGDIGGWLGRPSKYFLFDFLFELLNRSIVLCVLVGIIFISGFIFGNRNDGKSRWRNLCLIWFLSSYLIAYLYSIIRHPVIQYSTLLFSGPFLLLYTFSFIPQFISERKYSIFMILLFSLIFIYNTVVANKYYSTKHFGVFKEIAVDAEQWTEKYGRENVAFVGNVINPEYLNYYFNKGDIKPMLVSNPIVTPADFTNFYKVCDTLSSDYFSYVWSNSVHPQEVIEIIRTYYPYLIERKNYFNSASYLFGKKSSSSLQTSLYSSSCNFDETFWSYDKSNLSSEQHYSGTYSLKMSSEYGAGLRIKESEIKDGEYRYVVFSAMIFPQSEMKEIKLVLSFDRDGKPFDYHTVQLKEFNLEEKKWQHAIICAEVPVKLLKNDIIQAYIWNPNHETFYVDDLRFAVREDKNPYNRND